MRKLILTAVAVAGLVAGGSVLAQASQYDQATAGGTRPADVPPGTIRGPSGELQYWQGNGGRVPDQRSGNIVYPDGYNRYGYANGNAPAAGRQQKPRPANSHNSHAKRDNRDGHAVPETRDRHPDDPRRQ